MKTIQSNTNKEVNLSKLSTTVSNKNLKLKKTGQFLLFILSAMLLLNACETFITRIDGEGGYTSRTYTIDNFDEIRVSTYAEVYITKGATSLEIEGQHNILQALNVDDDNDILEIGEDNKFGKMKPLKVYVSTNYLRALRGSGKINISSSDTFEASTFSINMSGIGDISLPIKTEKLSTYISGDVDATFTGEATEHNIFISGQANIAAYLLYTNETYVDVSGLSDMEIRANDILDVDISGKGTIHYKGNPKIHQNISGSGSIISVN